MKRTFILIGIMLICLSANSQTALYKKYADRQWIRAYCVERYPLAVGDSVTVTLFEVEDTTTYQSLYNELKSMPYTPGFGKFMQLNVNQDGKEADSERKYLNVFNIDALPGDEGCYTIYSPSDRMVILAFHCRNRDEQIKVTLHMMATEF